MSVKSPLGLVLYCYLNMPTINKTYLIIIPTLSIEMGDKNGKQLVKMQVGGDKHSEIDGCNISKTISFKFWILKYGSPISEWLWSSFFEYMNRH
jgi:hypothetical protein